MAMPASARTSACRETIQLTADGGAPSTIRTPISRNYEAGEYAVSLMPPEKQEAVRQIFENYTLEEESYSVFPNKLREAGFSSEMESYAATHEKREAELKKILTDKELDTLMLHTMPQGTELQRDIIGMEPTEKELADIFKIADVGVGYNSMRIVKMKTVIKVVGVSN